MSMRCLAALGLMSMLCSARLAMTWKSAGMP